MLVHICLKCYRVDCGKDFFYFFFKDFFYYIEYNKTMITHIEYTEYYQFHPLRDYPNFCKTYAKWKRLVHSPLYLACLFQIQQFGK